MSSPDTHADPDNTLPEDTEEDEDEEEGDEPDEDPYDQIAHDFLDTTLHLHSRTEDIDEKDILLSR